MSNDSVDPMQLSFHFSESDYGGSLAIWTNATTVVRMGEEMGAYLSGSVTPHGHQWETFAARLVEMGIWDGTALAPQAKATRGITFTFRCCRGDQDVQFEGVANVDIFATKKVFEDLSFYNQLKRALTELTGW